MNNTKKIAPKGEAAKLIIYILKKYPVSSIELDSGIYLFSWDKIPGDGSGILIDFLKEIYDINWVEKAEIEKIDNDKTIRVFNEQNSLSLRLNKRKSKAILEINNLRPYEFIVKAENNKQNIYIKISRRTADYNLKKFKDWGIAKQLKDGRYAWIDYSDDEDKIRTIYKNLNEKFLGKPPLEAVSFEIKENLDKTKELLSKYKIYHIEPTEKEKERIAEKIKRNILFKWWINEGFHKHSFKKRCFEKGIEILNYSGIDRTSFSNLINNQEMPLRDEMVYEILEYSRRFPELNVEATVEEKTDQKTAYYEFKWNEDTKNLFKMLGSKLKPWEGTGLIPLPRRLDIYKYNSYVKSIDRDPAFVLDKIKELAIYSVLSKEALKDCLIWIRNPNFKNRDKVFPIFRNFCQNTKECEVLSPEDEEAITEALAEIAFVEEIEESLSEAAIEVIKIFDGEIIRDRAKAFFLTTVKKGNKSIDYLGKIAKWICIYPRIKGEIMEELERIILESSDENIRKDAKNIIQNYISKF